MDDIADMIDLLLKQIRGVLDGATPRNIYDDCPYCRARKLLDEPNAQAKGRGRTKLGENRSKHNPASP